MILAAGTEVYRIGSPPVSGLGLSWTQKELDAGMKGPIPAVVFDDVGKADVTALLAGLAATDFAKERLEQVLQTETETEPEPWRVGEAVAETYLSHHRQCHFPWPDSRDERKSGSSLPGADLVGIQQDCQGHRLAFGEVKTSSETKYPPNLLYGQEGLKKQLEDLQGEASIREKLFEYLALRATGKGWQASFQTAAARYLQNDRDVCIFGVLIRDVQPDGKDLKTRVSALASTNTAPMVVELIAIYLPMGSIPTLGKEAVSTRKGGSA
ncbi:MAG: hypothetical protein HQL82_15140 [Magnetococcales bacterium]|nr:hypothetical protein [Magnetococcales bacterium]